MPEGTEAAARRQLTGTCRPHPGDVSRRVALLREELGLSREQLALRAGMAPTFVQYVEEQSDTIGTGPLLRLAAALHTTAGQLLGAAPGPPPAVHELGTEECWDRLAEHLFGRVALTTPEGPAVIPVGYTVDGGAIACHCCTGAGAGAHAPAPGTEVAFEVDQVDETLGSGWSVQVIGIVDRAPAERGGEPAMRVMPERVSGRVIRAD
jgi:transcriptional regulator with XRE-family HTH domain